MLITLGNGNSMIRLLPGNDLIFQQRDNSELFTNKAEGFANEQTERGKPSEITLRCGHAIPSQSESRWRLITRVIGDSFSSPRTMSRLRERDEISACQRRAWMQLQERCIGREPPSHRRSREARRKIHSEQTYPRGILRGGIVLLSLRRDKTRRHCSKFHAAAAAAAAL